MQLPDYQGKPRANVFFVAYTRDGLDDASTRPITFAYNGGPGSSSVWLHLGALGPRRVDMGPEGFPPKPPYRLLENDQSWLDLTDLVFIDPVGTGYSRPVEGQDDNQFHGLEEDISSVGDFIRLWTTRNQRWPSPKFLAGESYGTTRNAGLANYLQENHGMYISGIVMISTVLNFQTLEFDQGNDTAYWLFLPTYAATAWYHKALDPDLQAMPLEKFLHEVEAFACGDYLLALARGDRLSTDERREIAARVARYTGLSTEYVEQSDLRLKIFRYTKELLRGRDLSVGRLDSRITGVDADQAGAGSEFDPSMSAISGPYTALLNEYVRSDLGYTNDAPYEILTGRVHPWNYSGATNSYVNVAPRLRDAMLHNRNLRVLFASGYYDLATPYFATEYTIAHLGVDPALRGNLREAHFEAGHMMYIREADLRALKQAVAAFYRETLEAPPAPQP
ncbi:MAG: peptidase S10 [Phycisphaerales bacterium]|nr:peptidase S10 [Phycisphaerales bacterium]